MANDKVQPWKAHWPAAERKVEGVEYAAKHGDVIIMDGASRGGKDEDEEPQSLTIPAPLVLPTTAEKKEHDSEKQ